MEDAKDEGDLHLVRVEERDLVGGSLPHGVDAERVGLAGVHELEGGGDWNFSEDFFLQQAEDEKKFALLRF